MPSPFWTSNLPDASTKTTVSTDLTAPKLWCVKILNDDFTPIEFVIAILMKVFRKTEAEAIDMTLTVHTAGHAVVGIYTKDVAQTKVNKATFFAEEEGHPLRFTTEPMA